MRGPHSLKIAICLMLLAGFMLACGLISQEPEVETVADLDATATEIAGEIFASQTAAAPENTPTTPATDTPEPTATQTPTPIPTITPSPTPTATPEPTNTPMPSPTPMPDLVVDAESLNVRGGPGTAYDVVTAVDEGDVLEILGQAYDCAWLKIETPAGTEGWISGSADYVTRNMACGDIPQAEIPATPTVVAPPTATPDNRPTANLVIINDTGENVFAQLSGPAYYEFNVPPGQHTYPVVIGTYNYTVRGCGGAVDTGTVDITDDLEWTWWCG